jgi:hypothetical protein
MNADPAFVELGYWADPNDPNIIREPNNPNVVWIDGDYHLLPFSPCIDAGNPDYIAEPDETDLDGEPRVINGQIDMGAYEYPGPRQTQRLYVDDDAIGANNGSSWDDAFNWLQDALAVAGRGDEILVAQGVYKPDQGADVTGGDREATFQVRSGVTVKGGYAGFGSPDPNERDVELYETILTGDLNGDDIEELYEPPNAENSYHVITISRTDSTTVLGGFIVIAGNADGDLAGGPRNKGGAVYNDGGSLKICNCKFIGNSAYGGGAIYSGFGSPKFINCNFEDNWASAMYNLDSSPELINCKFIGNHSVFGGAMFNDNSDAVLTDCLFFKNLVKDLYHGAGGGMYNSDSDLILTNCAFEQNWVCVYHKYGQPWSADGGGMYNVSCDIALLTCSFIGNAVGRCGGISDYDSSNMLTDSTFSAITSENHAAGIYNVSNGSIHTDWQWTNPTVRVSGGGIYISNSVLSAWNCTFAGNSAIRGNALACYSYEPGYQSDVDLTNCILWDGGNEVSRNDSSTITISYSDVQDIWKGQGNIDADPRFVQPGYWDVNGTPEDANDDYWIDGDHHLLSGSPCIDAGDPNYIPGPNETDLDGRPRVIGGRIDMGVYEFQNTPPVADAGADQVVECACNTTQGTKVTLDGTGSYDLDGNPLTFKWTGPFVESPTYGPTPTVILEDGCPGEYVITLVVNDGTEDSEPNEVVITVVDTKPPEFEFSVTPTILWPPNHKMVEIIPSWTVSDECDAAPDVSLVSIVVNEGDDTIGDGHTSDDIEIGDDGSIFVRSERSGTRTGRIYTITYLAVDDSGNETIRSATVSIPHEFKLLARMGDRWLWGNNGTVPEDLNGDGIVNFKDFAIFAQNWIK